MLGRLLVLVACVAVVSAQGVQYLNTVPQDGLSGLRPNPMPSCSKLGAQSVETCNYCKAFLEKGTAGACKAEEEQITEIEARLASAGKSDAGTGDSKKTAEKSLERVANQYLKPCQNVRDDVQRNAVTLRSWVQHLHPHFERYSFGVACADTACCKRGVDLSPFRECAQVDRATLEEINFCDVCTKIVQHRLLALSSKDPQLQRRKFDCTFIASQLDSRDPQRSAKLQNLCFSLDTQLLTDEHLYYQVYLRAKELFRETSCWNWNPNVFIADPCPELIETICHDLSCCA